MSCSTARTCRKSPAVPPRPISLLTLLDNRTPQVTPRPSMAESMLADLTAEGLTSIPAPPPSTSAASKATGEDGSPTRCSTGRSSFEQVRKKKAKNWAGKSKARSRPILVPPDWCTRIYAPVGRSMLTKERERTSHAHAQSLESHGRTKHAEKVPFE